MVACAYKFTAKLNLEAYRNVLYLFRNIVVLIIFPNTAAMWKSPGYLTHLLAQKGVIA